jgi:riboflavin kinase/FMN adenylyltransferase
MRVIYWPRESVTVEGGAVATLGVFDGVHKGHVTVINRVVRAAARMGCSSAAVTFDRHPASVLSGAECPSITSLEHRLRLLESHGLEVCVLVEFSAEVARMCASTFVRRVLCDVLRVRLLVVGFNCRFGRGRKGDPDLCERMGRALGFGVSVVPPVKVAGAEVSSTAIRQAITTGDLRLAQALLGRPLSLYGTVVRGEGRGRDLGFPTANLELHKEVVPPDGVYACWVRTDARVLPAVASVGRRSTFGVDTGGPAVVEVHVPGLGEDLYGQHLEVQFVELLRPQRRFPTARDLAGQIERDVRQAQEVLSRRQVDSQPAPGAPPSGRE